MQNRTIFFRYLTPLQILFGSAILAAFVVVAGLMTLTHQPWLGLQFEQHPQQGLLVVEVDEQSPAHGRIYPGTALSHIRLGKDKLALGSDTLQAVPHFTHADYASFNRYLQHQVQLQQAVSAKRVGLIDHQGKLFWLQAEMQRPLNSLPLRFWLYNGFGALAFLMGVGIWSRQRGRLQARITAVTGLVTLLFFASSAVMAGRELYLPMVTLELVLQIQRGSLYLFLFLLTAALALGTRGAQSGRLLALSLLLVVGLWLNESYQLIQWMGHAFLAPLLAIALIATLVARRQWRLSRDWPEQHANYKWLLLCLMMSIGIGVIVHLLPAIYLQQPAMGLWVWSGTLFFIYTGLLMGMYGERRFNIEKWWLETLAWFTGGVFVIGLDAALVFLLQLSPDKALGVAVLAIGWAYLPARHWLWKRIVRGEKEELEEYLPVVLETLLGEGKRVDLSAQWRELLQKVFEPMQVTLLDRSMHRVSIQQSGLAMHVPSIHGDRTIELSWRKRGARLFTLADARLAESLLRLFRNRDSVTGLPNRNVLLDRMRDYQERAQFRTWSIIFLRLKRFKAIMNLLGSEASEEVMRQIPKRLLRGVKRTDVYVDNVIAYLGNGEFAVLLPGFEKGQVLPVIQNISDELRTVMHTAEQSVDLSVNMGVASYPEHGGQPETLLQNAETAMHVAKEGGEEFAVYSSEYEEKSMRKMGLTNSLRRAIGKDLLLHYQPKLDLRTNNIVSVEALMRWKHSRYGVVSPEEFIPLAEQNNLIRPITYWALDYAMEQCADWQQRGRNMGVAVNISVQCLQDDSFLERVLSSVRQFDLSPSALTLEITESEFMAETSLAMNTLAELNKEGVRLSIDDFGTGYSSLSYLKRMPVDELKIDRSFISNMVNDEEDGSIVRAIIELAHILDLKVVAEGVEDAPTLQMLTSLGADQVQGYYVHKAIAANDLNKWLKTWEGVAERHHDPAHVLPLGNKLTPNG